MGLDERASILPAGTVTFLLTEAERSTRLGEAASNAAGDVLDRHHQLIDAAVIARGGLRAEEQEESSGVVAVFASATEAVAAALDIQTSLIAETWPDGLAPAVRIGLHTGEARLRDDRYYTGPALHRCARLRDVAHGGQTLLSAVTASVVSDALPPGSWLSDLGAHRLRDLSRPERIFQLCHAGLVDAFPPLRSLDTLANNLPIQLTSFVGRGDELTAVELLLAGERLVTLTGAGGCGKTRLAVQAAAEQADLGFRDGVWWVDLGPVTDPAQVAELVASTTGVLVEPVGGPLRALTLQLRDRRMLVCLDNCEHLLDACAELAEALLRSCPEVSVLATSREPLGVAGETVWRVPSLVEDEAVSLFAERASRVRPWFTLDDTNEAAVRTMCRRLDGIPLAVELAAAWLRTLTPAQIAAGLDDRFELLVRGPRGVMARQQTLAASMDWSHDLLDDIDRVVFRRLAVFAGGFTLDAARAVCAEGPVAEHEVLTALGRLVDKSLVVVDDGDGDGEARYRLLETMREYAHDRLDAAEETAAARDRHLDHFLALAETAEPEPGRADQDIWLARLETEHDNLRAALRWGLALPDPDRARRLAAVLPWLWWTHGHGHEGVDFLQQAISQAPDDRSILQARLLTGLALVADTAGPLQLELDAAQRGMEIAMANGDDRHRGRCLLLSAVVQFYVDFVAARELCEEARRCGEAAGDAFVVDGAFLLEALILSSRDRHEAARPLLEEGTERCLRHGGRAFGSMGIGYQVDTAARTGDVRLAVRLATKAMEVAEPLGDYYGVGGATGHLAWATGLAGDIDAGRRIMEPVVRSVEGADHEVFVPRMAAVLGTLYLWAGEFEDAVGWFEQEARSTDPAADSLIVARALPGLGAALRHLGRVEEAREELDRAVALTRRLDVPYLLAEALEQLGHLSAPEDPDRAEDLHHQALATRVDHGLRTFYVDSLDALAGLACRAESFPEAVRLLAASDAARDTIGYPRPPVDQPGHQATVDRLRAALGDGAFADAWADGAGLALDDVVAYVRRARGARGRPSTGWASLTPTELDVIRLVVEGLTNPEIGARLFMSRATVKTHLSHVYAKLGVANRIELATFASAQVAEP
jgi:predicted ATPase/class 3 adenylate cyclase/DNA-binding CsgD family transcriptional regulator